MSDENLKKLQEILKKDEKPAEEGARPDEQLQELLSEQIDSVAGGQFGSFHNSLHGSSP